MMSMALITPPTSRSRGKVPFLYHSYLSMLRAASTHLCCIRGEKLRRASIWRQHEQDFREDEVGSCYLCGSTQCGGSFLSNF